MMAVESTDAIPDTTMSSTSSAASSINSDTSLTSANTTTANWSDLLGEGWRSSSSSSDSSESDFTSEEDTDSMPDLHPAGYPDSDDEGSESDTTSDSGDDADDEEDEWDVDGQEDPSGTGNVHPTHHIKWVRHTLEEMYDERYEMPRDTFPRGPAFLRHVLGTMKTARPDLFRQELRISPATFDRLVGRLADDPIFANGSNNAQMPVEEQLAIVLFRFGHSRNAAGLQKVANWAGVGKGTITLVTRRVMTAVLRPDFMSEFVRMPTPTE
ncbi:hypothetical protein K438DRAFT_111572 [Mycena galopus ATCC 62051]|nr:hypothetical protein K438DRAFT_111572 [Mycena galopus ATCC 62051]